MDRPRHSDVSILPGIRLGRRTPPRPYFPDPGNAECCGRCHVRPNPCLKPARAEFANATQLYQAKLTQEVSADRCQSLSPEPVRWRRSERIPAQDVRHFFHWTDYENSSTDQGCTFAAGFVVAVPIAGRSHMRPIRQTRANHRQAAVARR